MKLFETTLGRICLAELNQAHMDLFSEVTMMMVGFILFCHHSVSDPIVGPQSGRVDNLVTANSSAKKGRLRGPCHCQFSYRCTVKLIILALWYCLFQLH